MQVHRRRYIDPFLTQLAGVQCKGEICNVGESVSIRNKCIEIAILAFRRFSVYGPSQTKCVSIVKTEVKLHFLAFGWLCVDPLASNAFRSKKSGEIPILPALLQPFSTKCISIVRGCGEIAVLYTLAALFRAKCESAVGNHAKG